MEVGEPEGETVSLNGEGLRFHRGSWGPAAVRARRSGARLRGSREKAISRTTSLSPSADLAMTWETGSLEKRRGRVYADLPGLVGDSGKSSSRSLAIQGYEYPAPP